MRWRGQQAGLAECFTSPGVCQPQCQASDWRRRGGPRMANPGLRLRDGLCPARRPPEAPGRAARYIALARRALGLAWSLQRKAPFRHWQVPARAKEPILVGQRGLAHAVGSPSASSVHSTGAKTCMSACFGMVRNRSATERKSSECAVSRCTAASAAFAHNASSDIESPHRSLAENTTGAFDAASACSRLRREGFRWIV